MKLATLLIPILVIAGCGELADIEGLSGLDGRSGMGSSDHTSAVEATMTSGAVCEEPRTVEVGVWGNGGECEGDPRFVLTVDLSNTCFGWERSVGDGTTRWNSATNLTCYRDRVCYTQHPNSDACEAPIGTTDKQWLVGSCHAGAMILSGTEDCPDAPEDACPLSSQQEGSAIVSCGDVSN